MNKNYEYFLEQLSRRTNDSSVVVWFTEDKSILAKFLLCSDSRLRSAAKQRLSEMKGALL